MESWKGGKTWSWTLRELCQSGWKQLGCGWPCWVRTRVCKHVPRGGPRVLGWRLGLQPGFAQEWGWSVKGRAGKAQDSPAQCWGSPWRCFGADLESLGAFGDPGGWRGVGIARGGAALVTVTSGWAGMASPGMELPGCAVPGASPLLLAGKRGCSTLDQPPGMPQPFLTFYSFILSHAHVRNFPGSGLFFPMDFVFSAACQKSPLLCH